MATTQYQQSKPFTGLRYRPGVPPGVYEESVPSARPLLVRLDTAAFIGLAQRGPVNTPVLVTSMPGFRAAFGDAPGGILLPQAVGVFFANGGQKCIVVRALDLGRARTARMYLPGILPTSLFAARNPGAWANRLLLRTILKRRALPLRPATALDTDWPLDSLLAPAHRAIPGVTLLLQGSPPPRPLIARITAATPPIRGVTAVTLDTNFTLPIKLATAAELLLRLDIILGETLVESWDNAALHPDHPDFLPRLLGRRAASEVLLPPLAQGGDEPDLAWGAEDDPPGSEFLRPSLQLQNSALKPTQALLDSADGLTFNAAELEEPDNGDDASITTAREHFFCPTPPAPLDAPLGLLPFASRPGALVALSVWDERNETSPIALVAMPDLLHPEPPSPQTNVVTPDDQPCFGVCIHVPPTEVLDTLPYPLLGAGTDDLREYQAKLVQDCESVGGRIALLDLPPGLTATDIIGWRRALASDRAALVAPWVRSAPVDDPLGAAITLPPAAPTAGLIARVELQTGVYASPANQTIAGVFALAQDPGLPEAGFLQEERINAVRITERGIQLMGSRTTSLDADWTHINVRRIVDWISAQLRIDLAWAPFEPNDARLWSAMTSTATRRLRTLFDAGALAGNTAAQSYFVRCDRTTITQPDLDAGRAIMLVGVAPAVPAEFLVFRLVREGGENAGVRVAA